MREELMRIYHLKDRGSENALIQSVNLCVYEGEVLGVLCLQAECIDTLCQLICGIRPRCSGRILFAGRELSLSSFQDARNHGIWLIRREPAVISGQSVASNILGYPAHSPLLHSRSAALRGLSQPHLPQRGIYLRPRRMNTIVNEYMRHWGWSLSAEESVDSLSRGEQLIVEIARAILSGARLIVFDQICDFFHMGDHFIQKCLQWIRDYSISVIFADNRMDPLWEISDRILVIKDGRHEGVFEKGDLSRQEMVHILSNRAFSEKYNRTRWESTTELFRLDLPIQGRRTSITLNRGSIVNVFGSACPLPGNDDLDMFEKPVFWKLYQNSILTTIRSMSDLSDQGIFVMNGEKDYFGLLPNEPLENNLCFRKLTQLRARSGSVSDALIHFLFCEHAEELGLLAEDGKRFPYEISRIQQFRLVLMQGLISHMTMLILIAPAVRLDFIERIRQCEILDRLAATGLPILMFSINTAVTNDLCDRVLYVDKDCPLWLEREDLEDGELLYRLNQQ